MDLVDELPLEPKPEYVDMVTVFEGNSNSAAVTSSVLANAGIKSWIRDEGIQGVFPRLGAAEVQVRLQDKDPALKALRTAVQIMDAFSAESL